MRRNIDRPACLWWFWGVPDYPSAWKTRVSFTLIDLHSYPSISILSWQKMNKQFSPNMHQSNCFIEYGWIYAIRFVFWKQIKGYLRCNCFFSGSFLIWTSFSIPYILSSLQFILYSTCSLTFSSSFLMMLLFISLIRLHWIPLLCQRYRCMDHVRVLEIIG
jgi:hypothetical protein